MKFFVTGGAGFIGSTMVDLLLSKGHQVVAYDNMETGRNQFLSGAKNNPNFSFILADLNDSLKLEGAMRGADVVVHFAANADVRNGLNQRYKDIEVNTIGTHQVLEAMVKNDVKKIMFSSTSSVYGEAKTFPTPENSPFPIQTSLYATSKLSGEGLISSYCLGFGMQCWIFRFVSVLGPRYTHGHVYDFVRSLNQNPDALDVLGNGYQTKSYMHVQDCINGMWHAFQNSDEDINIFNVGSRETLTVRESIDIICKTMRLSPKLNFGDSAGGWIGDNPYIFLSTARLLDLGWSCEFSIQESVVSTVQWLEQNKWCFRD